MGGLPTGTVTLLLTDVERSTQRWAADPTGMAQAMARHDEILAEVITRHHGVRPLEQGEGDSVVAAFERASEAVHAALEAQLALRAEPWLPGLEIRVRMAIHSGDARLRGERTYDGPVIIRCARIRALAGGGQVLVSHATQALIAGELPSGASLVEVGRPQLKGLNGIEAVFDLRHSGLSGGDGDAAAANGTGSGSRSPAPRLLSAEPHLPVPATPFLGRAREVAEVSARLRSGHTRLLTLTGAGGSGKTRLALRAAEALAPDYRDDVWFVGFADISAPELIISTISETLGLAERPDLEPTRRIQEWLGDRKLLLVLDNLEQLIDGTGVLGTLLASCRGLTLLATSREPLHLAGEQEYEVPVLRRLEACELFSKRAAAVKPGIEISSDVVEGICSRLDYLPLAVELAAARAKVITPVEILSRLDSTLPLLSGGPRDAPRRQRTLRATIDWSYELLGKDAQRLFARLGVFAGGCTLGAAEAVCDATIDTMHALVDRSLVRSSDGRYRMLQTLREYALERLDESGEGDEVRDAHARWSLELIHALGLDSRAASTRALNDQLAEERENLRAALQWASERGDAETVARLACPLTQYWWLREGRVQEAEHWVGFALEHLDRYGPSLAAKVLIASRSLAWQRGDSEQSVVLAMGSLDDARNLCEEALARCGGPASRCGAVAVVNLSHIANRQGRHRDASRLIREALPAALDRGDQPIAAVAASPLAWSHAELGEPERSARLLGVAAGFFERTGVARQWADQECDERATALLRARLAADTLNALLEEGRTMSLEEALGVES